MKYKNTDFNLELVKKTPSQFKKFFLDGGYMGEWEEAYKALGGVVKVKAEKPD